MWKQLLAKIKTKRERCQLQNLPRRYWISYIVYHYNGIKFWVLFSVVFLTTIWSYIKYIPKKKKNLWGGFSLTLIILFFNLLPKRFVFTFLTPLFGKQPRSMAKQKLGCLPFYVVLRIQNKNITLRCENYLWRLTTLRYHCNC